jgi:hypothetical protein
MSSQSLSFSAGGGVWLERPCRLLPSALLVLACWPCPRLALLAASWSVVGWRARRCRPYCKALSAVAFTLGFQLSWLNHSAGRLHQAEYIYKRTVPSLHIPSVICVHWVGWQPILLTCHAPMRTQKRQVAVLGRAHTKPRAKHIGVCAVARGIHRSFRSAIRLRTEGARSAGVDRRSYPITVRDARKACRLRATRRRLRATLGRRQGAREPRATPRRLQV